MILRLQIPWIWQWACLGQHVGMEASPGGMMLGGTKEDSKKLLQAGTYTTRDIPSDAAVELEEGLKEQLCLVREVGHGCCQHHH